MNLARDGLHGRLMRNKKENTQHMDKECVLTSNKAFWVVNNLAQFSSSYISATRRAPGLQPRQHITEHFDLFPFQKLQNQLLS